MAVNNKVPSTCANFVWNNLPAKRSTKNRGIFISAMLNTSYISDHLMMVIVLAKPFIDHPLAMWKLYIIKTHFIAHSKTSSFDKNTKANFSFAKLGVNLSKNVIG